MFTTQETIVTAVITLLEIKVPDGALSNRWRHSKATFTFVFIFKMTRWPLNDVKVNITQLNFFQLLYNNYAYSIKKQGYTSTSGNDGRILYYIQTFVFLLCTF